MSHLFSLKGLTPSTSLPPLTHTLSHCFSLQLFQLSMQPLMYSPFLWHCPPSSFGKLTCSFHVETPWLAHVTYLHTLSFWSTLGFVLITIYEKPNGTCSDTGFFSLGETIKIETGAMASSTQPQHSVCAYQTLGAQDKFVIWNEINKCAASFIFIELRMQSMHSPSVIE